MTSKAALIQARSQAEAKWDAAEGKLAATGQWCRDMLDRHQPFIANSIDVSISEVNNMRADLLERLGRSVFCTECRTPFPCRQIANLRTLRGLLSTGEYEGLPTKEKGRLPGIIPAAL